MSKGPRFQIDSTLPDNGDDVLQALISPNTARPTKVGADSPITGKVLPAVAKFGNAEQPPTLEECEAYIRTATSQWLLGVGQALRAIRDHELYKQAGYDSFKAYVRDRQPLGMQPPQVTRLIQAIPVVEALQGRTDREIKEGQARVLVPVERAHGPDAVRAVWDAATHSGYPSAKALAMAAAKMGYLDPPEDDEPAAEAPASPHILLRLQRALSPFEDLQALRRIATEEPAQARVIAAKLRQALTELEADLPATE